ncbi:MAG: DNA polymerase III subunit beta [Nitrospiraceae bacterium]|nr:DNA polymerase III subunit beta [Nitrospiraceae bacterium]
MKIYLKKTKDMLRSLLLLINLATSKNRSDEKERRSYILINAKPGMVSFVAADNRTFVVYTPTSGVNVAEPGRLLLSSKTLKKALGLKPSIEIHDSVSGRIYVGGLWEDIDTPAADFVDMPIVPKAPLAIINASDMEAVYYAVSQEDYRVMASVMMDLQNGHLVGTDGERLALRTGIAKSNIKAVIPRTAVKILIKIGGRFLVYSRSEVRQYVVGTNKRGKKKKKNEVVDPIQFITFRSPEFRVTCRCNEGVYPDYQSMIPANDWHEEITVNRLALIDAVKIARSIKLHDSVGGDEINVYLTEEGLVLYSESWGHYVRNGDYKEAEAHLIVDCRTSCMPPLLGTCISHRHLVDALEHIHTNDIYLGIGDSNKPVRIYDGNKNMTALIAPAQSTYRRHPEEVTFVQTACWIWDQLPRQLDNYWRTRQKDKDRRREVRRLLSAPLDDYYPDKFDSDDIRMRYRGNVIYNTVVDIMGILYPGWKFEMMANCWLHANKLRQLPSEGERLGRFIAYYRTCATRRIDFWGIRGSLGDIVTESQFVQAIGERANRFIDMVETARENGDDIQVTFLRKADDES